MKKIAICALFLVSMSSFAGMEFQKKKAPVKAAPPVGPQVQVSNCKVGPMVKGKVTFYCEKVQK